jgi:hypothetical protein
VIRSIPQPGEEDLNQRRWRRYYAVLTFGVFVPLIISFVFIRSPYPFAAFQMVKGGGDLQSPWNYYFLRGETQTGEIIDLPPVSLTDALANVAWSLGPVVVENRNFTIRSPHPANRELIATAGGFEKLPPGRRVEDLLRSWGSIYNSRLPANSPGRLRAIRLDAYVWPGGSYTNFDRFIRSWRVEL